MSDKAIALFENYNDTKVIANDYLAVSLTDILIRENVKSILICAGGSSARAPEGILQKLLLAFANWEMEVDYCYDIPAEPDVDDVRRIVKAMEKNTPGRVIAVGGGSVMDAAKAAYLSYQSKKDVTELFGVNKISSVTSESSFKRVICIPTTSGTGSEVTAVSVLTRHSLRAKGSIPHKIFPVLSLLDGKYLMNAPRRVITDTSIDALSHMYESYLNTKSTDFSRMCVDAGLKAWSRSREAILSGAPLTLDNCNDMLNASMYAGMAIAHTGTTLPHGLSYPLTYETGMPHGKACGYFLAGYLREADPEAASYLLKGAGFTDVDSLEAYFTATCGRDDVPADVLMQSVQNTLASPAKLAQCPFHVDEFVLNRIAGL
jgi:alcohol dehydrogenase